MQTQAPITEKSTNDIVCTFIRESLRECQIVDNGLIDILLPMTKNLAVTPLIVVMKCVVKRVDEKILENVMEERMREIGDIKDLTSHHAIVVKAFTDIMKGWFSRDKHEMCWERILMLIHFTKQLVEQLASDYQGKSSERVKELIDIAVEYIDTHMSPWIESKSGWNNLIGKSDSILPPDIDVPGTTKPTRTAVPTAAQAKIGKSLKTLPSFMPSHFSTDGETFIPLLTDAHQPAEVKTLQDTIENSPSYHIANLELDYEEVKVPELPPKRSHDVMVAYIHNNLTERNKADNDLDHIIKSCDLFLAPYEEDFLGSDILKAATIYSQKILIEMGDGYCKVLNDWKTEVMVILDITVEPIDVKLAFEKMLFSWFVQDTHFFNWDRIVILLEFLSDLVHRLLIQHDFHAWLHISELLTNGEDFFRRYINEAIRAMGGWKSVIEAKKDTFKYDTYDIPTEFIFDPSTYLREPKGKSRIIFYQLKKKKNDESATNYTTKSRPNHPTSSLKTPGVVDQK